MARTPDPKVHALWRDRIRRQEVSGLTIAQFCAQTGHESQSLSRVIENLNYSAQRLTEVWPGRFPTLDSAHFYEHAPERLANLVYANRMAPTERTNVAYAMIFPSATIVKVVAVQIVGLILLG